MMEPKRHPADAEPSVPVKLGHQLCQQGVDVPLMKNAPMGNMVSNQLPCLCTGYAELGKMGRDAMA